MADPGAFVLRFGKHAGKSLDQVPAKYLTWVLENFTGLYPESRAAIEAFLTPPDLVPREPGEDAEPRRVVHRRPRAAATTPAEVATCATCGLPGTPERPLVHARCAEDGEVPF